MTIDKKINYDVQGGVRNYLGKQKEVKAPLKWQSSPDHPTTELAYITQAEKDLLVKQDLHGSLNGDVNRGPSGIMSLDGYGSFDGPDPSKDTGMSGAATSDAEAGRNTANTRAESPTPSGPELPPGVTRNIDPALQGYRDAFINAGGGQRVNPGFFDSRNTVSPQELALAKEARNNPNNRFGSRAYKKTRGGGIMGFIKSGGLLGNLIRGVGRKFGLGKNYDEPTYDMGGMNTKVYETIPGVSTNPDYNNLNNELMLSTGATPQSTFDADTFDDTIGSSNKFMLPFEGARTIIPNPNFTGELGYEQPNIEFGGTVLKDDFNNGNNKVNINDIMSLIEASKQQQGIMNIDVGQDDIAFENDLMAKLSSNETRQKTILQRGQDLGMNTPEQDEKLEQLKQKEKEAALNTTAIV